MHKSDFGVGRKGSGLEIGGCGLQIGGGWQLAWKSIEIDSSNEQVQYGVERMYIHPEVTQSSDDLVLDISFGNKFIQASALVSKSVLPKNQIESSTIDLAELHQSSDDVCKDIKWTSLLTLGVKRALVVAIGLQMFQQVKIICLTMLCYFLRSTI